MSEVCHQQCSCEEKESSNDVQVSFTVLPMDTNNSHALYSRHKRYWNIWQSLSRNRRHCLVRSRSDNMQSCSVLGHSERQHHHLPCPVLLGDAHAVQHHPAGTGATARCHTHTQTYGQSLFQRLAMCTINWTILWVVYIILLMLIIPMCSCHAARTEKGWY